MEKKYITAESAPEAKASSLKSTIKNLKEKKRIEIVVAIVLVVIIVGIYLSTLSPKKSSTTNTDYAQSGFINQEYCMELEKKLNEVLGGIKGAGKVNAIINFESSVEILIAYIESKSNSTSQGGDSQSTTTNPQILQIDGDQLPLILKEIYPAVKGVLISAQGASDSKVRYELLNATATLLGVSPAIIYITQMS